MRVYWEVDWIVYLYVSAFVCVCVWEQNFSCSLAFAAVVNAITSLSRHIRLRPTVSTDNGVNKCISQTIAREREREPFVSTWVFGVFFPPSFPLSLTHSLSLSVCVTLSHWNETHRFAVGVCARIRWEIEKKIRERKLCLYVWVTRQRLWQCDKVVLNRNKQRVRFVSLTHCALVWVLEAALCARWSNTTHTENHTHICKSKNNQKENTRHSSTSNSLWNMRWFFFCVSLIRFRIFSVTFACCGCTRRCWELVAYCIRNRQVQRIRIKEKSPFRWVFSWKRRNYKRKNCAIKKSAKRFY